MRLNDKGQKVPVLCSSDLCTACSACLNSCPQEAITMRENTHGEFHPYVNHDLCIGCGRCERACPELNGGRLNRHPDPVVYCCWLKDSVRRGQSTSGGAAYALSVTVIKNGGHVWGAAFDESMTPRYVEANTISELKPIQKSKYVQCAIGTCYRQIREELRRGELVLFTGTSCHVRGLLAFLRKDYPNLLTCDLVCHGVPGSGVFRKYREWLEQRYHDKLVGFQFRYKRKDGQEVGYCTVATFENLGEKKISLRENGYYVGFLRGIYFRSCCYDCQGNGIRRYSDFTVADFWGLGKVEPFNQWQQRTRGISMMALNSEKGRSFFEQIKPLLEFEERTVEKAICSNHPYIKSAAKPALSEIFWNEWQLKGWADLTSKYFSPGKREIISYVLKRITPPNLLSYIKYRMKWIK